VEDGSQKEGKEGRVSSTLSKPTNFPFPFFLFELTSLLPLKPPPTQLSDFQHGRRTKKSLLDLPNSLRRSSPSRRRRRRARRWIEPQQAERS